MFTYKNWEKVCISFSNKGKCGKTAIEVLDKKNTDGFLIFKHDVETSPERALDIAKIESKYMHKGSYYVQAYLLDSDKNVRILKQIKELGHEVTYHHDVLDSCSGNFESAIQEFEKMLNKFRQNGFDVKTVCQHGNPIKNRIGYTSNRDLYFKVNRDLTLEVAKLAKDSKVNHFIFLSSMSVYGIDEGVITKSTKEQPKTAYGISKLEAESLLKSIESSDFKVAILRPPMVYGDGCKGNYNTLIHFAERFPFFPSIRNKRSMLFIDTLCEFVKDIINRNANGLFFPQNVEYSCTSNLVMDIAKKNGKTIMLLPFLNPLIRFLMICPGKIGIITKKAFGNLVYDSSMSK
ncbi:MAG: NAD-dependent epimerase/dehydratase family protein [Paludibacter sp.]|nr:NAD-dependent epimerase/dehydratase family protein [Paludibacter sp.]